MMGSLYGHRWASSFGKEVDPDHVWRATLAGLTEQQIRAGLRQCVERGLDWPPTAPEFRKFCLGLPTDNAEVEHRRIAAADRDAATRALPAPFDYDAAAGEMAKIRALLGTVKPDCDENTGLATRGR